MATDPNLTPAVFTDAELDAMALPSPEDVERAKQAWRTDTKGTGLERLLDATEEPTDGEKSG